MGNKRKLTTESPSLWESVPNPDNLKMDSDKPSEPTNNVKTFGKLPRKRVQKENVKALQDILLKEGMWAVKRANKFADNDSFIADLETNLSQNSAETRKR